MDAVIECFKSDFDRFWGLLEQQIALCPEDVWVKKIGRWFYWQEVLHILACVEINALPEGQPSLQTLFPNEVAMFSQAPDRTMTKAEAVKMAADMKNLVHNFIAAQSAATLTQKHPVSSKILGRELTNQHALIGLIRHVCYHLGCCDAILREHGLQGVY